MSGQSILLSLDGAAQSRYAAELCWMLAKANNMSVDAQHVVDSLAAWDFLNFDIAGFIGSEPFFEAHETMLQCLTSIGESLTQAYEGQAAGHAIAGNTYLDEGTTIREICWRAKDHTLVAIGQRSTGMNSPEEDKRRLPRRSIAESLTYYCPRPLLVVQDRCEPWTKMKIVLSSLRVPSSLLESCLNFAKQMKMEAQIRLVLLTDSSSIEVESDSVETCAEAKALMDDLSRLLPAVEGLKVDVKRAGNLNRYWRFDAEENDNALLVVPVTEIAGVRKTTFGTSPDTIVRYLNHPAVLFWMAEQESDLLWEQSASSLQAK
ncbi:MAG: universal stress protein [Candidatus Obscuribacterales bacterium]|nr:universal stress protein [Candidatus Obscuribacterales bacterium]